MTLGLKRYQQSRQSHFVTFTCYRRLRHLDPAGMKDLVIALLEQTRRRFSFYVYGFVVMPEHVHFWFRSRSGHCWPMPVAHKPRPAGKCGPPA